MAPRPGHCSRAQEAPKWPPRAQARRRCRAGRSRGRARDALRASRGPRATRESGQLTISRAPHRAGGERRPPVADPHADLRADPPLVVPHGQAVPGRRAIEGSSGSRPCRPSAPRPNRGSSRPPASSPPTWVEPGPGVQSGSWGQSGCCAHSWFCVQSPGCVQSLFPAVWPSASVPAAPGRGFTPSRIRCPSPAVSPRTPAQARRPGPLLRAVGPGRAAPRPARITGMSWATSPEESGFHTRWR